MLYSFGSRPGGHYFSDILDIRQNESSGVSRESIRTLTVDDDYEKSSSGMEVN